MSVLRDWLGGRQQARSGETWPTLTVDDWLSMIMLNGFPMPNNNQYSLGQPADEIPADFQGMVQGAMKNNGVVYACLVARMLLFSEARFQFQQMDNGKAGALFGTQALLPLEEPWAGGSTSDLLSIMSLDVDLAGNAFIARGPKSQFGTAPWSCRRLQPDWVTIVGGSQLKPNSDHPLWEWDTEVIGYIYHPGGRNSGQPVKTFLADEVAHFKLVPDPTGRFRGMSWITPVIKEIRSDDAATTHKLKFFEQGATVNTIVSLDKDITPKNFKEFVEAFEEEHTGVMNAYKTIYLGGGADVTLVGANMQQASFKEVQGAGETRICAAARVPPIIIGLSEGLDASTYSNYGQAKRAFGDLAMRPMWRNACGSLQRIVDLPRGQGVRLWYDPSDISFLQEDATDTAAALQADATTIAILVKEGFEPDSVVKAVNAGDMTLLKHTGLVSVQLQPPGSASQPETNSSNLLNGNGNGNSNGNGNGAGASANGTSGAASADYDVPDADVIEENDYARQVRLAREATEAEEQRRLAEQAEVDDDRTMVNLRFGNTFVKHRAAREPGTFLWPFMDKGPGPNESTGGGD
jgi:hypothetical protein